MPWIIFALLTPAFFGVSNFIEKFLIEKRIKNALLITFIFGITSTILGIGTLAFKGFPSFSFHDLTLILISGLMLFFYLFPYFKALSLDDVSRIIPFFSFIPIFLLIFSYVFLGEKLTPRELIGFAIVVSGGFILGAEKIHKGIFTPRKSLWFMLLSSFMYALAAILFKSVLKTQHDFFTAFGYQYVGLGIGTIMLLLYRPNRVRFISEVKHLKADSWVCISLNETVSVLAELSYFYALTLAPVALVSVIGSTQPFFVLVYGLILSTFFPHIVKEEVNKAIIGTKIFSILLIFLGIYLLYT